jgi:glycosyltransferase involved in cell wall biosynthesis
MKFSIITPSFRNSSWLKLCIASVADQTGVELEHIVQDSCSDDGTQDWLPHDPRVKAFIEKDAGMYDAVNRGYRRATGDILAYLNCDEQYLPGALAAVQEFFEANPGVEVALAGSIVTDGAGQYLCHRHSMERPPRAHLVSLSRC